MPHKHEDEAEYHYDCAPRGMLDVHGGITFAAFCRESAIEERGICHVPDAGEPDRVWWFGFDCSHCDDISPAYQWSFGSLSFHDAQYRNVAYVQSECAKLAQQLAALNEGTKA